MRKFQFVLVCLDVTLFDNKRQPAASLARGDLTFKGQNSKFALQKCTKCKLISMLRADAMADNI